LIQVSPSLLSADFGRLASEISEVEAAGADSLHVDVMDGHYVPNITIGPLVVRAIGEAATLPFDVHLMITDPLHYAREMSGSGARGFFFHPSTVDDAHAAIGRIRALGAWVGVAINPDERAADFKEFFPEVDYVLVMTVFPGFGGQKFIESALENVRGVRSGFEGDILVDGGVSAETAGRVAAAGGNVMVAGSAVFSKADRAAAIEEIRRAGEAGR